jgi:hypothetical protein
MIRSRRVRTLVPTDGADLTPGHQEHGGFEKTTLQ